MSTRPGMPAEAAARVPEARWEQWVSSHWRKVRVVNAEICPPPADAPPGARLRAVIYLGALTPADVFVDAVSESMARSPMDEAGCWPVRLHSMLAYRNGEYVFEATLPPEAEYPPGDIKLRVTPRDRVPLRFRRTARIRTRRTA